ncbi:hypothetical protein V6Z11_1Z028400 [Gossypium hirsutum]
MIMMMTSIIIPYPKLLALDKNGAKQQVPPSCLDDTATSSPLINFFKTYDEVSMESIFDYPLQGLSATHLMGGPTFRDHCGFYQYSLYGNQLQTNHWFLRKMINGVELFISNVRSQGRYCSFYSSFLFGFAFVSAIAMEKPTLEQHLENKFLLFFYSSCPNHFHVLYECC